MSYKYQLAFTYFIDQEPIWRDMTFATTGKITDQRMVAVFRRKFLSRCQHFQHAFQQRNIVIAFFDLFQIPLKT